MQFWLRKSSQNKCHNISMHAFLLSGTPRTLILFFLAGLVILRIPIFVTPKFTVLVLIQKNTLWKIKCAKIRTLRAFVSYVSYMPTCFTYSCALRAFLFLPFTCLPFLTCLTCYHIFYVPFVTFFSCPLSTFLFYVSYVLNFFTCFTCLYFFSCLCFCVL